MATVIDRTYLSSIEFLDQRDILNKVLDLYDEEKTILDVMEMTGRAKVTAQPEFHNFVNDWLYKTATVASATLNSALVTDADGYSTGTITLTSANDIPIIGELGMQPLTGSIFLVVSVSGADVGVKSLNTVASGDEAYSADWTASDVIVFFSNAHGEGTGANNMRISNLIKELNYIQIFKTKHEITDLGRGSKVEVEFDGKPYFFIKQQHDAFIKHRMDIIFAFILGKRGKTLDANGKTVYTTEGIDHYITDRGGISRTVAAAGTLAREDLRLLARVMDKARCPDEYFAWAGGEMDNHIDDLIGGFSETVNGGISYNAFGRGDAKQKAIDLGINSFRLYGRTWHKKRLPALDHARVTAITGASEYPGYVYLIPTDKIKVDSGTDGGGMMDRICTRFMEFENGKNTRYNEKLLGGLAPIPTNDIDVLQMVYTSTEGFMMIGVPHFARLNLNDAANYI